MQPSVDLPNSLKRGSTENNPRKTNIMKTTQTLLTGIIAALAFSVNVNAEGDDKKGAPGEGKNRPSKEAMAKHRAAMKAKMLERFDADKDGKLSDTEKATAKETIAKERKEIHAAIIAQFDTDKDKKLTGEEKKGVREWVKKNYPDAIHMRHGHKKGKGGPKGNKPPKGDKKEDAASAN